MSQTSRLLPEAHGVPTPGLAGGQSTGELPWAGWLSTSSASIACKKPGSWVEAGDEPILAGCTGEGLTVLDRGKDSLEINPELRVNELVEVVAVLEDKEVPAVAPNDASTEIQHPWKPRLEVLEGGLL